MILLSELDGKIDAIGPALMSRFESDLGYRNFPETIACRKLPARCLI